MRSSEGTITSTFKVGHRECTLTVYGDWVRTQWSPDVPQELSKEEMQQYRAGRRAFTRRIIENAGGCIVVAEAYGDLKLRSSA
jgi:hypothetical protein